MKLNRSVTFNVFIQKEHEGLKQKVRDGLKLYRDTMKVLHATALCAEEAGAEIIVDPKKGLVLKPGVLEDGKTQRSKNILEALAGVEDKKAHLYPLYYGAKELAPEFLSKVWSALQREVSSHWRAKDPEFTKASKGWLILQGVRRMAQFQNVPLEIHPDNIKFDKHELLLQWDRNLGYVPVRLLKLDGGRWHLFRSLASGNWHIGAAYLYEH